MVQSMSQLSAKSPAVCYW